MSNDEKFLDRLERWVRELSNSQFGFLLSYWFYVLGTVVVVLAVLGLCKLMGIDIN